MDPLNQLVDATPRVGGTNPWNPVSVMRDMLTFADAIIMVEDNPDHLTFLGCAKWNVGNEMFTDHNVSCISFRTLTDLPVAATHEIGHNVGCQHDTANCGGFIGYPVSYAHGYISRDKTWGDLMSLSNRKPWFSNPDSTYSGERRGDTARCNTTRLMNERINTLVGIRNVQSDPRYPQYADTFTLKANDYCNVPLLGKIVFRGVASILDSAEMRLAGNQINIKGNFYVGKNAKLTINNGVVAPLGKRIGQYETTPPEANLLKPTEFSASARMIGREIQFTYSIISPMPVAISIFDISGRLIALRTINRQFAGTFTETIKSGLPSKMYIVKITTPVCTKQFKLFGLH